MHLTQFVHSIKMNKVKRRVWTIISLRPSVPGTVIDCRDIRVFMRNKNVKNSGCDHHVKVASLMLSPSIHETVSLLDD